MVQDGLPADSLPDPAAAARSEIRQLLDADPASASFAIIHRQGAETVDLLLGESLPVEALADVPLEGQEVVAMVPFRQVAERGFDAIDDGEPVRVLVVDRSVSLPLTALTAALPAEPPAVQDLGFNLSDEEYAAVAQRVIEEEIGRGEGANFVIRRDYSARTDAPRVLATLAWLRRLLETEVGSYWTFAFVTPGMAAVGASPERHVSATRGRVMMNPISGTLRHGDHQPTEEEILRFLADRKESEELVMVVDEELKMMSAVCPGGGVMRGPFLKPMTKLTHTEYLLEGTTELDPREVLRLTMFAPTVTGSPMGNACTVIARHESSGRGYYSGVIARFTPRADADSSLPDGGSSDLAVHYDLDAPILIRTAFLNEDGDITVSAGATLVRHSDPLSEAQETRAKAAGVLGALGLAGLQAPVRGAAQRALPTNQAAVAPEVQAALADRNRDLARFWRDAQRPVAQFAGNALVIDCNDDFTAMLGHQLRRLGLDVDLRSWADVAEVDSPDLVVFGPGPGDPLNVAEPRIARLRELISRRLDSGRATLAVCLSHQILSSLAGLPIEALPSPRQGMPLEVDIAGEPARIGYYNTFTAVAPNWSRTPRWDLLAKSEPETGFVHALLGPGVASVQGHLESVLSFDGFSTLTRLVLRVLDTERS